MAGSSSLKLSRAGDVFHYRWAARRCLRLIDPQFGLESVIIEGSKQPKRPGELVIDVSEYSEKEGRKRIDHFQLKHSTVRIHRPMTLADLARTLEGFGERYLDAKKGRRKKRKEQPVPQFTVVSNRPVSAALKADVVALANGRSPASSEALAKATGLATAELADFCGRLSFADDEGDYRVQKRSLQGELKEYLAGFVDGDDADQLVALVIDRVMPVSEDGRRDGRIVLEEVLKKLGVNSQRDLFPAPPKLDPLPNPIRREQHADIVRHILAPGGPAVVHAAGGVGKSVVARLVSESLPKGSRAIIYDCFGSGTYLSASAPRHRARDALIQIANELAAQGLCTRLLPRRGLAPDDYFRDFKDRLRTAVAKLREVKTGALLVLLIDAADNAEMAAKDRGEACFASGLLGEAMPAGCRLAMFARSERVPMLKPGPKVRMLALSPFSAKESFEHLRRSFPGATPSEAREFHRLSSRNPRVQANALQAGLPSVAAVLANLGPNATTLNAQIGRQLQAAIDTVRGLHSQTTAAQVDAICYGLANLPPLIPIPVLAQAADVPEAAVHSFISDLGRPLWGFENAVQFRDEPTETWFREQFAADDVRIKAYAEKIAPLAAKHAYVATALPLLLLRAGELDRLVALALSDDHLPVANAIERRNVRVYRLQFAFKAALKLRKMPAAARLAFRAGEEVAGDHRQTELLGKNLDLVAMFEEANRVQEIAYRHELGGGWPGCENIYSAALLSSFGDLHGDAQAFLRSAERWLSLYFEDRKKQKKSERKDRFGEKESLQTEHIIELWWTHLNMYGPAKLVSYVKSWTPKELPLQVVPAICSRLIDAGRFREVEAIVTAGADLPHLVLVMADALVAVGRLPPKASLAKALEFFADPKGRPAKPERSMFEDPFSAMMVSFLESCAARGLRADKILEALDYYEEKGWRAVLGSDHQEGGRKLFLRTVVLRTLLRGEKEPTVANLFPPAEKPEVPRDRDDENRNQMVASLLPWHFARMRLVLGRGGRLDLRALQERASYGLSSRYREFDRLPAEMNEMRFEVLAWRPKTTAAELRTFQLEVIDQEPRRFWLQQRLVAARIAFRLSYHAMHRLAGELLKTMPVVNDTRAHWSEDEWPRWRSLHGLTRADGRWVSDRRDPEPRSRRPWVYAPQQSEWLWSVKAEDFKEIISDEAPLPDALCVDGYWSDHVHDRIETIRVNSALVDRRSALALANSLRYVDRTHSFRIPSYREEQEDESGKSPFDLNGWIGQGEGDDPKLDSFDPYAKQVSYPPRGIGQTYSVLLGLAADLEKREWRNGAGGPLVVISELWSDRQERDSRRQEERYRHGRRVTATVACLRDLCVKTKRDLIICVEIDRRWDDSYKPGHSEYIPHSHKLFIFSADGRLRDAAKSYQLR